MKYLLLFLFPLLFANHSFAQTKTAYEKKAYSLPVQFLRKLGVDEATLQKSNKIVELYLGVKRVKSKNKKQLPKAQTKISSSSLRLERLKWITSLAILPQLTQQCPHIFRHLCIEMKGCSVLTCKGEYRRMQSQPCHDRPFLLFGFGKFILFFQGGN